MSVLIIDLGHFKKINDKYGHLVGDVVLMELAGILRTNIRECDAVGRWGGEEFLVMLLETNQDNAFLAAEKIRATVEKTDLPEVKRITCSMGVATFRSGDHQESLLHRADMALYEAKKAGRNRVKSEKSE